MTKLAIIGAAGIMGSYSARALAPQVDELVVHDILSREILEKKLTGVNYRAAESVEQAVKDADIALFCVPTEKATGIIERALPACKKGALISGQTSRKAPEIVAFDRFLLQYPYSKLEMVTIHTMCNPYLSEPKNEILGIIRHRSSDATYERAYNFFSPLSSHVEEFSCVKEHDTAGAYTQINVSRTFLSIASSFAHAGCFPWINASYGGSFDVMKFSLAMRAANVAPHVYRGIQFGSPEGRDIVRESLAIEQELFSMIVSDKKKEYQALMNNVRHCVFGEIHEPILSDSDMSLFEIGESKDNDDFSVMQWLASYALLNRKVRADFKATTPMHRALYCLTERLCMTDRFEQALEAPFRSPSLKADCLVFDRQIAGWSEAILYENQEGYNARHAAMLSRLEPEMIQREVEKSKVIIHLCRERFDNALKAGRI